MLFFCVRDNSGILFCFLDGELAFGKNKKDIADSPTLCIFGDGHFGCGKNALGYAIMIHITVCLTIITDLGAMVQIIDFDCLILYNK